MRRLTALVFGVSLALVDVATLGAQTATAPTINPCPDEVVKESGVYTCRFGSSSMTGGRPASSSSNPERADGGGTAVVYVPYKRISADASGNACIETIYIPQGTPARPSFGLLETEQTPGSVSGLYDTAPPCPERPSQASSAMISPIAMAIEHWSRVPLPRPQPRIAPGRAITGKLAYLETRGSLAYTYSASTVLGLLQIHAVGVHWVDWGDGEETGPYNLEGTPWPDGQVVHHYIDVGNYNVTVTTRWTATWVLAGSSGPLPPTQTQGRIDDFPVEQIQAVIGR
jgi:hypothetical protein